MRFRVETDLSKDSCVSQRAVYGSGQHRLEVNGLRRRIVELDADAVVSNDLEVKHANDWMAHTFHLSQRLDRLRRVPCLQAVPVRDQLGLMELGPRLHEPSLAPRQLSGNQVTGSMPKIAT
jgi:hypothetical protein